MNDNTENTPYKPTAAPKGVVSNVIAQSSGNVSISNNGRTATITISDGSVSGMKVNGWEIEAKARPDETVTVEVEYGKITERRVRSNPDGSRGETVRVIERP